MCMCYDVVFTTLSPEPCFSHFCDMIQCCVFVRAAHCNGMCTGSVNVCVCLIWVYLYSSAFLHTPFTAAKL